MQLCINITHFVKNAMLPTHTAIVVDDDRDVNIVLAGILKLKKFDVHKVYSAEECLEKLKELEAKVDVITSSYQAQFQVQKSNPI